jgi:hypothetical protein
MRRRVQRQLITRRLWRKWLVPYIATLAPARQRFVQQAVQGILASGSLILSEMARALRERSTRLVHILKRFSRHLGAKAWHPAVLQAEVLERNASWVYHDTPVVIDLSEIAKPHARRMAHLCKVRDASSTDKRITRGYWLFEAYAEPSRGMLVPLMVVVFSTRQRRFLSQNHVVLNAMERLDGLLGERGIFLFDRGFDARVFLDALLDWRRRFVLRLRTTRDLICRDGRKRRVGRLALRVVRPHDDYGTVRATLVRLPKRSEPLLFVATPHRRNDPRPIKLLAWLGDKATCLRSARRCRRLYFRRWRAEDGIRFLKSGLGLETVRVMTWHRLEHMITLAVLAMTLVALAAQQPTPWRTALVERGRSRQVHAGFLFYRILRGIAHLLQRHPLC